jgi:very-short-patch-repair endonuclease
MSPVESKLERHLKYLLHVARVPDPYREYRFHPERKWRFDFAWPDQKLAAEVEGGIWTGGAHTRGKHFNSDCEKYNAAALAGWRVLRFSETHLRTGEAVHLIREALGMSAL